MDLSDRPLGSLTMNEIGRSIFWGLLWFGPLALIVGRFIDHDFIDWEAWGKFGLWLLLAAAVAVLWLSNG